MTAKKATPKKPAATKAVKPWQLPLVLDAKAQKQLEIAHKITGEKTATKAIIQCLFLADHYMKEFKKEQERANILQEQVREQTHAINLFCGALKQLDQVANPKPGSKKEKSNKQLTVLTCDFCDHPLDKDGDCPDCDG